MRGHKYFLIPALSFLIGFGVMACRVQEAYAFDPDAAGGGVTPPVPVVTGLPAAPAAAAGAAKELPVDLMPQNIFLKDDELKKIKAAIEQYQQRRSRRQRRAEDKAKDFLNQLDEKVEEAKEKAVPQPKPFTYPQFYLAQLSYQNEQDWLVWINGKKFSSYLPNDDSWIRVVGVDKEQVVLEWRPDNMKVINHSLLTVPMEVTESAGVIINNAVDTVTFTLKPNQTFSSYAMRVVEGKVSPVHVMLLEGEPITAATYAELTRSGGAKAAATPPATIEPVDPETEKKFTLPREKAASLPPSVSDNSGADALNRTYERLGLDD